MPSVHQLHLPRFKQLNDKSEEGLVLITLVFDYVSNMA